MTVVRHWLLYQLHIKNILLRGDLEEEVYMSNQLVLLLRESPVAWCVDYAGHFMVENSLLEPGLKSLSQ